jgi:hypothetical protein
MAFVLFDRSGCECSSISLSDAPNISAYVITGVDAAAAVRSSGELSLRNDPNGRSRSGFAVWASAEKVLVC